MPNSDFLKASAAAEHWPYHLVRVVRNIGLAKGKNKSEFIDRAMRLLVSLHESYNEHIVALNQMDGRLKALNGPSIAWDHASHPHRWSSGHEASAGLARLALDLFELITMTNDWDLQWRSARRVLPYLSRAIPISPEFAADLAERIRRERAMLMSTTPQTDSAEELPLLQQAIRNGHLTVHQRPILEYLLEKQFATYDQLAVLENAFKRESTDDRPSNEAITKKLKNMRNLLRKAGMHFVELSISPAGKRVDLKIRQHETRP